MIRDMTTAERRAYNAGIRAAIDAARIVAITIECAEDANTFRKQVAAGTLAAFADSAKVLMLNTSPLESHCLNVEQNSALSMMVEG